MDKDTSKKNSPIDAGKPLLSWEAWEFEPQERSNRWYAGVVITGLLLMIYAIWSANPMFAIIILMTGVLILINSLHKPNRIQIHVTTVGIVVGHTLHEYKDIIDFSIIYNPPIAEYLYIDTKGFYKPLISIALESVDPIQLREILLQYADENLTREDALLTDLARRRYKL